MVTYIYKKERLSTKELLDIVGCSYATLKKASKEAPIEDDGAINLENIELRSGIKKFNYKDHEKITVSELAAILTKDGFKGITASKLYPKIKSAGLFENNADVSNVDFTVSTWGGKRGDGLSEVEKKNRALKSQAKFRKKQRLLNSNFCFSFSNATDIRDKIVFLKDSILKRHTRAEVVFFCLSEFELLIKHGNTKLFSKKDIEKKDGSNIGMKGGIPGGGEKLFISFTNAKREEYDKILVRLKETGFFHRRSPSQITEYAINELYHNNYKED
jgi:hypothetical protein